MKQRIKIGRNVTNIMALPCIQACRKLNPGTEREELRYEFENIDPDLGSIYYYTLFEGDVLIEYDDGRWGFIRRFGDEYDVYYPDTRLKTNVPYTEVEKLTQKGKEELS